MNLTATPMKNPDELTADERADIILELEKEDDIIDDEAFDFDMGFDSEWDTKGTFANRRKSKAIATAPKVDFSGGFEAPAPGNPW